MVEHLERHLRRRDNNMGKKRRKKNRKDKDKYNKKQFIDIYCHNCGLCSINPPDPIFCYEELYNSDPNKFLVSCFAGLLRTAREMEDSGCSGKDITMKQFHDIFCVPFCEEETCSFVSDCYHVFKDQIKGTIKSKVSIRKNRKKKKKKRGQYICQPYPTMFTNDNKEWQIKIENILSNGNNNREQNKVEKSTEQSKGQVN